jgi:hypothetical protein
MAERAERVDRKDPKGYYAALGVSASASAVQIKLAFRERAKLVHPDLNPDQEGAAKDAFQRLNEAYQVLGNAAARARYDSGVPDRQLGPSASPARRPALRPDGAAGLEPMACRRCGAITAQPRYAIYWRVMSYVVGTLRQPIQGVFCRRCADHQALRASAVTWLLGWWGVPSGPVWTAKALWLNLRGGEQPTDINVSLLRHQARYFWSIGHLVPARAALDQALRLVRRPDQRQRLLKLQVVIGPVHGKLVDRWRPMASWAFYLQLVPAMLVSFGLLLLVDGAVRAGFDRLPAAGPPSAAITQSHGGR